MSGVKNNKKGNKNSINENPINVINKKYFKSKKDKEEIEKENESDDEEED